MHRALNDGRLIFRQRGGKRYRGISLTPAQFWEFDKVLEKLPQKTNKPYLTQELGSGIHFTRPNEKMMTLWKQSKGNPYVETAFFRFDDDSWQHYINAVHKEVKSLLHSTTQE